MASIAAKDIMNEDFLSATKVLGLNENKPRDRLISDLIGKPIGVAKFNRIMSEIGPPWPNADEIVDRLFDELDIKWRLDDETKLTGLDDRPKVFVANHPYGLPDALAMFRMLSAHRPRLKLFANTILSATKLNDDRLLYVDPFMAEKNRGLNRSSVARALRHLRDGGDLALFPGRICSHLKTSDWTISDSEWTDQVHRFVQVSGGHMVPIHISGRNSMAFNLSGLIHPRFRTYMLLREFLKGSHDFRFKIGNPLDVDQLAQVARTIPAGDFARNLTYTLKTPGRVDVPVVRAELISGRGDGEMRLTASNPDVEKLVKSQKHLITQNRFSIFATEGELQERLIDAICETRLQAYSTETKAKKPEDLRDRFDAHYNHLLLWDNERSKIAGTYRYYLPGRHDGQTTPDHLVTNSIFDLSESFMNLMPNSMELGRAAIHPDYQKSFAPLIMLWRGILEVPAADKSIKYLFGPVTMGRNFQPVSRELLRRYLEENCMDDSMQGFIKAKRPLELGIPREVALDKMIQSCRNFSDLGNLISGFESGRRTLPVLFRHYTNVGCRYLGVGEWKELDYSATGLTMLSLKDARPNLMLRYLGAKGAEEFAVGR